MSETTTGQRGALGELHPDAEARQYCLISGTHTVRGGGGLQLRPPRQSCPAGDGQAHPGACPTAEPSWYEDAGHAPPMEDPGRFNTELAAFVRFAAAS